MAENRMEFRKPCIGDEVCCRFTDGDGEERHVSAVVVTVYDDASCVLLAPGKDGKKLVRLLNMPFATSGLCLPAWHWPYKPTSCPACEDEVKPGYGPEIPGMIQVRPGLYTSNISRHLSAASVIEKK